MAALTWTKASSILKELLVEYLDGPFPRVISNASINHENDPNKPWYLKWRDFWLQNDMDLYGGSLILSLGLLVLACMICSLPLLH